MLCVSFCVNVCVQSEQHNFKKLLTNFTETLAVDVRQSWCVVFLIQLFRELHAITRCASAGTSNFTAVNSTCVGAYALCRGEIVCCFMLNVQWHGGSVLWTQKVKENRRLSVIVHLGAGSLGRCIGHGMSQVGPYNSDVCSG